MMSEIHDTGTTRTTNVARSSEALRETEMDDTWGSVSARAVPTLKQRKIDGSKGEQPTFARTLSFADVEKRKKKKTDDAEGEEDDDIADPLDDLWGHAACTPTKVKRSSTSRPAAGDQ